MKNFIIISLLTFFSLSSLYSQGDFHSDTDYQYVEVSEPLFVCSFYFYNDVYSLFSVSSGFVLVCEVKSFVLFRPKIEEIYTTVEDISVKYAIWHNTNERTLHSKNGDIIVHSIHWNQPIGTFTTEYGFNPIIK